MSYVVIDDQHLTDIAEAIRAKDNSTTTYKPRDMAAGIRGAGLNTSDMQAFFGGTMKHLRTEATRIKQCGCACNNATYGLQLESVSGPYVTEICYRAFNGQQSLKSIDFPNVETIGNSAFQATNLSGEIIINATTIGSFAFKECAFTRIDLPKATYLGGFALHCNSTAAQVVILRASTMCKASLYPFNIKSDTRIYVPAALLTQYTSDDVWSEYASNFRAIEDYPSICG